MSETKAEKITSPMKAIRAKCIDCCGFQINEVRLCTAVNCPLHPFRFGKNPFRKTREMSEEEKAQRAKALEKARAKRLSN